MEKRTIFKLLIIFFCLIHIKAIGQSSDCTIFYSGITFTSDGGVQTVNPSYFSGSGCSGSFTFNTPSWIDIVQTNGTQLQVTCQSNNNSSLSRTGIIEFEIPSAGTSGTFSVYQGIDACYEYYYVDSDGDGFGDVHSPGVLSCSDPFNGQGVTNNSDFCPEDPSNVNNGCPSGYVHEDRNWTITEAYDIDGTLKVKSKSYFDALGKNEQVQTLDIKTGKVWQTQTLYDSEGRAGIQTLSAPINSNGTISYNGNFIKNSSGVNYSNTDFEADPENPSAVDATANTLGHYYSIQNVDPDNVEEKFKGNDYFDITQYPFSRTIFSKLNPGQALKRLGGNKFDEDNDSSTPDQWVNGYSFSMRAGQELSQTNAFNNIKYDAIEITKTVVRDVHGVETVVFTDSDGKTLASAWSGEGEPRAMTVQIGRQGFVDIHIPKGADAIGFTVDVAIAGFSAYDYTVYDLITEQDVTTPTDQLANGFYRVAISDPDSYVGGAMSVTYNENYYDYSLNEYDEAGRLLATYQPLKKLKSEFKYDALGQLIYSKSPDEGEAWFKYRKDGQIRFSQNSKQRAANQLSYTNYDELGRPIESGVVTGLFGGAWDLYHPDTGNGFGGTRSEQQFTQYDEPDVQGMGEAMQTLIMGGWPEQRFVAGNVSKTSNENAITWYSYDVYGRVEWIVQYIPGLGTKTIDYKYDPVTGNVEEVDYQKYVGNERYVHHYTYNEVDELIEVKTSSDGNSNAASPQARYYYYETGALRRIELADNLQGIDYVYNLAGQLKAINHPSGSTSLDPGEDGEVGSINSGFSPDVFSMSLDYYKGDYTRTGTPTPINAVTDGEDRFNGNIKAMTWYNKHPGSTAMTQTYYYGYNKNNWLISAGLGAPIEGTGAAQDNVTKNGVVGTDEDVIARESITLLPGFHVQVGTVFTAKIDPNAQGADTGDYNVSNITYDANGNILSLNRNKQSENGNSSAMDQLTYEYYDDPNVSPYAPNQLKRVDDAIGDVSDADDIGSQLASESYKYNSIGQLVEDWENVTQAELDAYTINGTFPASVIRYVYNASGLVAEVQKGNNQPVVKFYYNDKNHRVRKEAFDSNGNPTDTDHYVRDAEGNTLAIYRNGAQTELPIYGSSRIGVHYKTDGTDRYQLTDHLGNVRAVIARGNPTPSTTRDYYPFGMPMPGRETIGGEQYRYAFQGQEKDLETGKEAFELRLWDSRIARWLTTDPYGQYNSPYLGMGNNPINGIDPDGGKFFTKYKYGDQEVEVRDGVDKTLEVNAEQFEMAKIYASIINNEAFRSIGFGSDFINGYKGFFGSVNYWENFGEVVKDYFNFNISPRLPSRDPIAITPGGEIGQWLVPGGSGAKLSFAALARYGKNINWSWKSVKTFRHTFSTHGAGVKNFRALVGRANSLKASSIQGQWLNNEKAAAFLKSIHGKVRSGDIIEIPKGLGQVVFSNGTTRAASYAKVILDPKTGLFKTAYPYF